MMELMLLFGVTRWDFGTKKKKKNPHEVDDDLLVDGDENLQIPLLYI
ncbi:hypothetical protein HanXRQr2_Chr09g0406821 [Helianthus annuus]|uniref:Uncharacterized protein n=1 Tax=Helianthus annuus TaxID=4232 RepID=A0A9K3I9R4_HELAN|nr:hypothetical protein HanXRQr2_Chr09g0406821 [Helianthus annuus]